MDKLRVGDKEISYEIRKGTSPDRAYLRLRSDFVLEVVVPRGSEIDAQTLLRKKRAWIERKYDEISHVKKTFDVDKILFNGEYRRLRIIPNEALGAAKVEVQSGEIVVEAAKGVNPMAALRSWVTEKTRRYVTKTARSYAHRFGIPLRRVYVWDMAQWGRCRRTGDLIFNWQIIALPRRLADYVIFHELAHLSEFSHSRKFRTELAAMCPDFKEREKALKGFSTSEFTRGSNR